MYKKVAALTKDPENKKTMELIADDELKHYSRLKELTGRDLKSRSFKVLINYWFIRIFGLTFGIKLLERGESKGIESYSELDQSLKIYG